MILPQLLNHLRDYGGNSLPLGRADHADETILKSKSKIPDMITMPQDGQVGTRWLVRRCLSARQS